jgi:hypothetical protein
MNPNAQTIIRSITYDVPSRRRTGKTHQVSVDPRDMAIVSCTCEAGQYGKTCWHRDWARNGRVGKPRVRVTQRPVVHRARTSDYGREIAMMLDV